MATPGARPQKKTSTSRSTKQGGKTDATQLLMQDHREVKQLFSAFEKAETAKKDEIAEQICLALKVHTQIEEELFYPAARGALKDTDEDIVDEAVVEHAAAKQLIGEIEGMNARDDLFDAKVKVLSEQIDHHVGEEETELFPKVRKTDLDLQALGSQMASRKAELIGQMRRTNGRTVQ